MTLGVPDAAGIRLATRADVPAISKMLARAFHDDPVYAWIFPDPAARERHAPAMFTIFAKQLLRHGVVLTDPERRGAALWRPYDMRLGAFEELSFMVGMLRLLGRRASEVGRGFAPVEARHPRDPHVYLPLIGTDPSHQGSGIGSTLLAPVLRMCDARGLPAYLESSKMENVPFYRRHGFELLEPIRIPSGPTVWPMKRVALGRA